MGAVRLDPGFVVLVMVLLVPLVWWYDGRAGRPRGERLARAAACGWVGAIVALALFPLPLPPYESAVLTGVEDVRGWPFPWASPVPFRTIAETFGEGWGLGAGRYLVGNVVAFVPLGVLASLLDVRWRSWARALLLGLLASALIEGTQLTLSLLMGVPWRVADIDDVLLNALGTVLGFGGWRALGRWRPARSADAGPPI